MTETSVTVIIPVDGNANTAQVTQCLRSIFAQSYRPLNVLLLINPYSEEVERAVREASVGSAGCSVRVECFPRVGLPAALNLGLYLAEDSFVARMDCDDVMHPARIELQVAIMKVYPDAALVCTDMAFFDDGEDPPAQKSIDIDEVVRRRDWRILSREFLWRNPVNHPTVLMRLSWARAVNGYNPRYPLCEDEDLWQRIRLAGGLMIEIPYALHSYRVSRGSYSQSTSAMILRNAIRLVLYFRNMTGWERICGMSITLVKLLLVSFRIALAVFRPNTSLPRIEVIRRNP